MRTPQGVSQADFSAALAAFESAVGSKQWVFTSEEDLDLYRDAYSPLWGQPDERIASAAVAPDTVEQVQAIVRIANQYKVPLYPISTGRNLGYGGSAPSLSGSVVLDLKRMNRILDVNEGNASVLVEPGVSYFDLYRHLQERKSKLWIDVPDPGWGSLVGNALDRGGGYTMPQYRNHFDAHCGMEIVLPNGELMRTGMGAMPKAETWQQYKSGFGPWIDGMFSQSNFGVVTKMGFWMMPEPEAFLKGTISVSRYTDLVPLVDILNSLENNKIFNGFPDLGSPLLGAPSISQYERLLAGDVPQQDPELVALLSRQGGPSTQELEEYGIRKGVAYWNCSLNYYGPAKVIRAQWEHTQAKFSAIAGAKFKEEQFYELPLTEEQKKTAHAPAFGIPTLRMFSIGARSPINPLPTRGHMWFAPIIPRTGEAVMKANRVLSQALRELDVPALNGFTLPSGYWERAFIYIVGFPVTDDPDANRKYVAAFRKLIAIAAENGWGEYRTAPAYQDDVMRVYSFNNHALLRFHESIKDAIDPNGILSPGRYGIWPKHLRKG
jgi:FAD/FMN-containing dehydrogenase